MNFLEYSNQHHVNIIQKDKFQELTYEVFNVIASNIGKSLGPLGAPATILDGMMTEATKDGYSIFKKYRFHNRYKKMIYNLIKSPCQRLNNTVGDGTTTAIVFAHNLFREYTSKRGAVESFYRLPRQFTQAWDEVVAELIDDIKKTSNPIDPDDYNTIYNICYVTSNGNHEISKVMADTYMASKSPAIKQKDSPTNKSYMSPIVGFEFPANLIDPGYIRNEDLSVEEKDICVMIIDHKVSTDFCENVIIPLNDVLKSQGKKLLVLASSYDSYLCDTLLKQYMNQEWQKFKKLNLILAQYAIGKLDENQLIDLATVLRTFVVTQELETGLMDEFTTMSPDSFIEKVMSDPEYKFSRLIGCAASALLSCKNGSIFRVNDIESDERYQDILRAAKKDLEDIIANTDFEKQSFASKIYTANARISQLEMRNYIYYIGADSSLQKQIIWDSVEDVIKCVRSAIKYGVVPGCQLSINTACNNMMNRLAGDATEETFKDLPDDVKLRLVILEIIQNAVLSTYAAVLRGPDGTGLIKTIPLWQYVKEDGIDDLRKEADKKCGDIIKDSIQKNQVFDLESLECNSKIITSAETDMMVLTAASELVKILINGNQCIFLDSDVNESHNEDVEIPV